MTFRPTRAIAAILFVATATMAMPALAQTAAEAAGPFAPMRGSWTGSGTVKEANGSTERLRCQATYQVERDGESLRQQIRCSSDSYSFELRSDVAYNGGSITGSWTETTRGLSGSISGRSRGGDIRAAVQSPNFSASVSIATRGNKQTVSIRSPGTVLTNVDISLDRRG